VSAGDHDQLRRLARRTAFLSFPRSTSKRYRVAALTVTALLVGTPVFHGRGQPGAQAQEKPGGARVEYKVVYSTFETVAVQESRVVNGQPKVIEHGPAASAEEMTRQFNALAADGWEYAGAVATTGQPRSGFAGGQGGVLTLFKRAKPWRRPPSHDP
jgi:hypothetical protein